MSSTCVTQKILLNRPKNIPVYTFSRRHAGMAAEDILRRLQDSIDQQYLGLAMKRSSSGRVALLALARVDEVFLISVDADRPPGLLPRDEPFQRLLRGESCGIVGFDLPRIAIRIAHDMGLRVRGIDLSTAFAADTRNPLRPSKVVTDKVSSQIGAGVVDDLWSDDHEATNHREVCLRAWLAVCVATATSIAALNISNVDTGLLKPQEIVCLGELIRQTYVLEDARPKETPSEFNNFKVTHDGMLELQNARYKTRIRNSRQVVIMTNDSGHEFSGQAHGAKGRTTNIRFTGQALSGTLQKVRVVGRQELTNPEKARDELLLLVLQGKASLRVYFIQRLWFPTGRYRPSFDDVGDLTFQGKGLNDSQARVASRMVSDVPLVIAHGPPGTGKTTTIAAAVSVWDLARRPAWIVAHSNVAVKNIAETLFKKGVDFKILVSKEFHFEWHEHIYHEIQDKVLRSDDFSGIKDIQDMARLLGGSCIILSTLSMLSNPTLDRVGLFRIVPVARLVVDEASQIKIEDFLHIFQKFHRTLEKVCFFGDPKQLPPFGKDEVPELRTIFDVQHLQDLAGFLDTQYRMPVPLGDFISSNVYGGRLKSQHAIKDTECVSFIDVSNGEERKSGFSWTNDGEIQTMVNLVTTYYKWKNFCIITPYDAQRAAIERQLKQEDLPWEQVFNVDSFQGNEADFVLVSVVRSGRQPGFLASINRMNVLLTRCRKGLVIVTSRSFIRDGGQFTLLGYLERRWMDIKGESTWVGFRAVSEGKADLPSAPGPNRANSGSLLSRVPGAPLYYSTAPVASPRTFDTKLLFRPLIPRLKTEALPSSLQSWLSATSYSSSGASSPALGSPVSSTVRSCSPRADRKPIPTPAFQPVYRPSSFQNRSPDYEKEFPSLPVIDVLHWKPSDSASPRPASLPHLLNNPRPTRRNYSEKEGTRHHTTFPKVSAFPLEKLGPRSPVQMTRNPHSLLPKGTGDKPSSRAPVVLRLQISQKQITRTVPSTSFVASGKAQHILNPDDPTQVHSNCRRNMYVPPKSDSVPPYGQSYRAAHKVPPTGVDNAPSVRSARSVSTLARSNGMSNAKSMPSDSVRFGNRGVRTTRSAQKAQYQVQ
ncbi:hypothetical protein D9615_007819 [Tricholomella constricta]|uniref:DNA2/NAM7 helicase-like C-terminal domain-containing protein n=1 Tax=Tricholomella constricta TaxID=117010 RepID=A0A8H5H4N7_9AGAR|nr:hypothetical protein D9615_007819 [Tricholomella constricta]